jgi:hypothetical protein
MAAMGLGKKISKHQILLSVNVTRESDGLTNVESSPPDSSS